MPARKNRPNKHGGARASERKPDHTLDVELRAFVIKLIIWERKEPRHHHYVGWPDMHLAEELKRRGLLLDDGSAYKCFRLTEQFRTTYYEEMH